MKTALRMFALALVATGTFATLHAATTPNSTLISGKISSPPVPMCPPGDPNGCGISGTKGN